jgi:uncharacterized phage protein (TIGR01671 family)
MREIKFRGLRKADKTWSYGDLIHGDGAIYVMALDNSHMNSPDYDEVIPETVGQFTGLTDKNGVEIYEGDLLNIGANEFGFVTNDKGENVKYQIRFEGCDYITYRTDLKMKWGRLSRLDEMNWNCEVIGSIHKNPTP